jgi:hypothetical protein
MVTPDINEIIKKSLSVAKNIMFYLPRTIDINELFELVQEETSADEVYFDIHVLESANKIKAILLLYGPDVQSISKNEIQNFITMISKEEDLKEKCKGEFNETEWNWNWKETTTITRKFSFSSDLDTYDYLIVNSENKNSLFDSCSINLCNSNSNNFNRSKPESRKYSEAENKEETKVECKEKEKLENKGLPEITTSSHQKVLWKVYNTIGTRKFFEALIKFKEKYSTNESKKSLYDYLPCPSRCNDLIKYFTNEVLTDKQLTRLHM